MIEIELHRDVKRIAIPTTLFGREVFSTNSYLVGDLLIDTGPARMSRSFLKVLEPFIVETVVNTHAHADHVGSNFFFPFVFAHPEGFERLKHPKHEMLIQRLLHGLPKPCTPREIPKRIKTDDFMFDVLYTPGHSPDHISLYESEQKWAFTGDLLLWGPTREVFTDVKIYDAMNSLRILSKLEIEILFPGHGPSFNDPNETLRNQVETLETFEMQIKDLHENGLSANEIRNRIFGKEGLMAYLTGKKFSALNLVNSYLEEID